jgi:RimJ/RimL family protein N-acetyltransferase
MSISLVSPFPVEHIPVLWAWMNEYRHLNFDDGGCRSAHELGAQIYWRELSGEIVWEVRDDGTPIGAIGYRKVSRTLGEFRGICFTSCVHGTPATYEAVAFALRIAFSDGIKAVRAEVFAHNQRVQKFLAKLGGVVIDYIPSGSIQNGVPIDWKVVEVTASDFLRAYQGHGADSERSVSSKDIPATQ